VTAMQKLGKLQRIELRDIWASEAQDFTPWLAQEENLSSLAGISRRPSGTNYNNYSLIQIDAAVQPGNSGGPIINDWGNVVGVTVSQLNKIAMLKETGSIPENTNFGIKSSVVKAFIEAHGVDLPTPNSKPITKRKMVDLVTKSTHLVSCYITGAQARKLKKNQTNKLQVSPTILHQIEALLR
jgi:hypothetical protein